MNIFVQGGRPPFQDQEVGIVEYEGAESISMPQCSMRCACRDNALNDGARWNKGSSKTLSLCRKNN
jgi:hypothetical protein